MSIDISIEMEVGSRTYGVTNIKTFSWGEGAKLKLGKFCSIADGCRIYLGGNHQVGWYTTYPFGHVHKDVFPHHGLGHPTTKGNVVIGHDVWIGANVTIMSGVSIGHGAIIANNSHVVKSVAPYTIVGGNPANVIRKRFSDDEIEFLLELEWWNMPEPLIAKIAPILCSTMSSESNQIIKDIVNQYYISIEENNKLKNADAPEKEITSEEVSNLEDQITSEKDIPNLESPSLETSFSPRV